MTAGSSHAPPATAYAPRVPDPRRAVPRTDTVLADPRLARSLQRHGRDAVKGAVRQAQDRVRTAGLPAADVVDAVLDALPRAASSLRPVLNCTGAVLHTNLGRAALSGPAVEAVTAAAGATDVEMDLTTGRRARRGRGVLEALREAVPAAGDVHVVNNGAAALVLAATALAAGGEVLVSRGELVEIGDGFRLPDLLESTGARLREVGTTNRTTLADYAAAVGPETRMVLKVHPSNFVVTGFTAGVEPAALATLGVPVVVDTGSGLLRPDPLLPDEPDADTALRGGATLVTTSGDKLLGGPQAGLLLGDADVVDRLRRHPLARALRVDKLTLAALEATLRFDENPTWQALRADPAELRRRCDALAESLRGSGVDAGAVASEAVVGGGGAPGLELPSWAVELPEVLAAPLREQGVVGRSARGHLLLDLRCVPPADDARVATAVLAAAASSGPTPSGRA